MEARVRFSPSGREIRVAVGTTLLEAARRAGLPMASACGGDALCGRCGVLVLAGSDTIAPEEERETSAKRRNRVPAGQRLACRIPVSGELLVTASYW
jgi:uncharacterized 2Fe-2S/4Fe-4S cluster protein (DUF4445 family)